MSPVRAIFSIVSARPLRLAALICVALLVGLSGRTSAAGTLTPISTDPFPSTVPGQHATEAEPDNFSYGGVEVTDFQVGRIYDGGSAAAGFATLRNGVWSNGLLPGLTKNQTPPGAYDRVSDPSITYDAAHGVWLASTLALTGSTGVGVLVNRSPDGIAWSTPVTAALNTSTFLDKPWIVCDNSPSSPFRGHCYVEYDDANNGERLYMTTSTDGGLTWSTPISPAGTPQGLGGQPLVQPNGTVVVPALSDYPSTPANIISYRSTDGGTSWTTQTIVATVQAFHEEGSTGLRVSSLPSAEIDAAGKVFVAWRDCRFESGCTANDIVYSTSTDGLSWTSPVRLPIDAVGSGVDHFTPGFGVDHATSGAAAHLGVVYDTFPNAACTPTTCTVNVGFISSTDGGATWSTPQTLATISSLNWIPQTSSGRMLGDYLSTSFVNGSAIPTFPVAKAPSSSGAFDQGMYAASIPLMPTGVPYSRLRENRERGGVTLHWYAARPVRGFEVYDGRVRLNTRPVTSRTGWYVFHSAHPIHALRLLPLS